MTTYCTPLSFPLSQPQLSMDDDTLQQWLLLHASSITRAENAEQQQQQHESIQGQSIQSKEQQQQASNPHCTTLSSPTNHHKAYLHGGDISPLPTHATVSCTISDDTNTATSKMSPPHTPATDVIHDTSSLLSSSLLQTLSPPSSSPLLSLQYHLVLDLDQTLIDTLDLDEFSHEMVPGCIEHIVHNQFAIYFRPHMLEFLAFCFARFKTVSIWSAGDDPWVHPIASLILDLLNSKHNTQYKFHLIWTRKRCIKNTNIKPLRKMWRMKQHRNPQGEHYMTQENTLMIDDSRRAVCKNYGNAIHVPSYSCIEHDNTFHMLKHFLEMHLFRSTHIIHNVRTWDKRDWHLSVPHHQRLIFPV